MTRQKNTKSLFLYLDSKMFCFRLLQELCNCSTMHFFGDDICSPGTNREHGKCVRSNMEYLKESHQQCAREMCKPSCKNVEFEVSKFLLLLSMHFTSVEESAPTSLDSVTKYLSRTLKDNSLYYSVDAIFLVYVQLTYTLYRYLLILT